MVQILKGRRSNYFILCGFLELLHHLMPLHLCTKSLKNTPPKLPLSPTVPFKTSPLVPHICQVPLLLFPFSPCSDQTLLIISPSWEGPSSSESLFCWELTVVFFLLRNSPPDSTPDGAPRWIIWCSFIFKLT